MIRRLAALLAVALLAATGDAYAQQQQGGTEDLPTHKQVHASVLTGGDSAESSEVPFAAGTTLCMLLDGSWNVTRREPDPNVEGLYIESEGTWLFRSYMGGRQAAGSQKMAAPDLAALGGGREEAYDVQCDEAMAGSMYVTTKAQQLEPWEQRWQPMGTTRLMPWTRARRPRKCRSNSCLHFTWNP